MARAKPAYDKDGSWKYRQFDDKQWEDLKTRVRKKIRSFYPDKSAIEDPVFGHPADSWANYLLSDSYSAVSAMLSLRRRLTNEELRAEREDLLGILNKAVNRLNTVSQDLDILLGLDADVLGARDKINELIPKLEATGEKIDALKKANTPRKAGHSAAVEMAIRCLRILKNHGGTTSATADKDLNYISDAVQILKIIGDELWLPLDETTWKATIIQAKQMAPDLR